MEYVSMGEAVSRILGTYIAGVSFEIRDTMAILQHKTTEEGVVEYVLHNAKIKDEIDAFTLGMLKGMTVFLELKNAK